MRKILLYILYYILVSLALLDPDRVLYKLKDSLHKNIETLVLFTNNQSIISDHQELLHLVRKFEIIKNKIDMLIMDIA